MDGKEEGNDLNKVKEDRDDMLVTSSAAIPG
jgi:hypothetical protein